MDITDTLQARGQRYGKFTGQPSDEEGPSIEDVEELCEEHCFNVEGYESIECLQGLINEAIARWGRPAPAPPADGEVAELARWLRSRAGIPASPDFPAVAAMLTRAADLLEQRHPVPVPVSERLPGPEDCDAEGRCWLLTVEDEYPQWRLHSIQGAQSGGAMIWVPVDSSPGVLVDCFYTSHWLPATALPVPQGEVE